jgi:putative ABC transport system permease protein
MLSTLKQNIAYSLRTFGRNKRFTLTAVLTLALGIGATTAIFSVVYAVFEPMPYPKPNQLVIVWSKGRGGRNPVARYRFSKVAGTKHVFPVNEWLERRFVQRGNQ